MLVGVGGWDGNNFEFIVIRATRAMHLRSRTTSLVLIPSFLCLYTAPAALRERVLCVKECYKQTYSCNRSHEQLYLRILSK